MEDPMLEEEKLQRIDELLTRLERIVEESEKLSRGGEVDNISAMIDPAEAVSDFEDRLQSVEREVLEIRAARAVETTQPLRKTLPTSVCEMLAKQGIEDGPIDLRRLDTALSSLSVEQRIAVKSKLHRAGSVA